jgi:hypothetical protein
MMQRGEVVAAVDFELLERDSALGEAALKPVEGVLLREVVEEELGAPLMKTRREAAAAAAAALQGPKKTAAEVEVLLELMRKVAEEVVLKELTQQKQAVLVGVPVAQWPMQRETKACEMLEEQAASSQ